MGRHLGYDWKQTVESVDSKQQHRQRLRRSSWDRFSHANIISDEHGLVPRKVRRSISLAVFKRAWNERKAS